MKVTELKPAELARLYLRELNHVHTRSSNHPGHIESDLTVRTIRRTLRQGRLFDWPRSLITSIVINDHTSDSSTPYQLAPFGFHSLSLRLQSLFGNHPRIFYGLEASILPDGIIDAPLSLIEQRPIVIASRHKLPTAISHTAESVTKLMVQACEIPEVDVLGHPARDFESMKVNWTNIFDKATSHGKVIELNFNTYPDADETARLEFWDEWLACLARSEVKICIGSDIHTKDQLRRYVRAVRGMLRNRPGETTIFRMLTAIHHHGITPDRLQSLLTKSS